MLRDSNSCLFEYLCEMEQATPVFDGAFSGVTPVTYVAQALDWPAKVMIMYACAYWLFLFVDLCIGDYVRKALSSFMKAVKQ